MLNRALHAANLAIERRKAPVDLPAQFLTTEILPEQEASVIASINFYVDISNYSTLNALMKPKIDPKALAERIKLLNSIGVSAPPEMAANAVDSDQPTEKDHLQNLHTSRNISHLLMD